MMTSCIIRECLSGTGMADFKSCADLGDGLETVLQTFRRLLACPGCFRLERSAGRGLHPLEMRRLVTAHGDSGHSTMQTAVIADCG